MSPPPLCHYLPTLDAALPLCGADALLATLCTMHPAFVTCAKCQTVLGGHVAQFRATINSEPSNKLDMSREARMSERAFLERVRSAAVANGWLLYHTHRSDRSPAGFPDLILVKPGGGYPLIAAELKAARGKLSAAQAQWLEAIAQAEGIVSCLWRPRDLTAICEMLHK